MAAISEEDNYIRVRRKFFDRYGRVVSGNTFKQNDMVIVQITLEKAYNGDVENVVITDLLPAGFEIENPRTKEISGNGLDQGCAYAYLPGCTR